MVKGDSSAGRHASMLNKVSAACGLLSGALAAVSALLFLSVCNILSSSCPPVEATIWGALVFGAVAILASVGSCWRGEPGKWGRLIGLALGAAIWIAWSNLMFT
ncbi:MAG: hypothetical protein A2138_03865 [Deltaproteobacteria bacterium RBG_16_71_12]|nr:MAG: hypothetical protein A2138_03865 [Deltaproteobacteria bacterium RBG_16_71_12]